MINKIFIEILACPICFGKLIYDKENNELLCLLNKVAFPIYQDIPILLKQFARAMK
ncbi:MAG: hypothetical protein U0T60_01665 [Buchnera aphidicola (Meitanaphis microgallis)]